MNPTDRLNTALSGRYRIQRNRKDVRGGPTDRKEALRWIVRTLRDAAAV